MENDFGEINIQGQKNPSTPIHNQGESIDKNENSTTQKENQAHSSKPDSVLGNPFTESLKDFKKAEEDYFSQIETLKKQNIQEEERIKISRVESEELKKEQEIAEREARLRIQREELEKREEEIRRLKEEKQRQIDEEARLRREEIEAENKRKKEQEERLKRLEEEEAYQKKKLEELEIAESESNLSYKNNVSDNLDSLKESASNVKLDTGKTTKNLKSRKKMPIFVKVLIPVLIVVSLFVVGVVIIKNVNSTKPDRIIVSRMLYLGEDTFYEGDEIVNLEEYYISLNYSDNTSEKVPVTFGMITSDFVKEQNGKWYITNTNKLESRNEDFVVIYDGVEYKKTITIKSISDLRNDALNFRMVTYVEGRSFYEFDTINIIEDISVQAKMKSSEKQKILTPYQFDLFVIDKNNNLVQLTMTEDFKATMLSLNEVNNSFSFVAKLKTENSTFVQPDISVNNVYLLESHVNQILFQNAFLTIKSQDFYETRYEETKFKKDIKREIYDFLNSVYGKMSNRTETNLKLNLAIKDEFNTYSVFIDKNNNYKISKSVIDSSVDLRRYFVLNSTSIVIDEENNAIYYIAPLIGTKENITEQVEVVSLQDDSIKNNFTLKTEKDKVKSAELISGLYRGDINYNDVIDISNNEKVDNLVVQYIFESGKVIVYNSLTNQVTKIDGENILISLETEDFRLKLCIPNDNDIQRAYRYNTTEFLFGNDTYGIGERVKLFLRCEMQTTKGQAITYIYTENVLQEKIA